MEETNKERIEELKKEIKQEETELKELGGNPIEEEPTDNKTEECIFCKIIKGEITTEKTYEDENFIAILDTNPKTENHTLLISKKHFRNLLDMPSSLGSEYLDAIKKISLKLIQENKSEGINILTNNEHSAGQIIFHTHTHIIPRKKDDNIKTLI